MSANTVKVDFGKSGVGIYCNSSTEGRSARTTSPSSSNTPELPSISLASEKTLLPNAGIKSVIYYFDKT